MQHQAFRYVLEYQLVSFAIFILFVHPCIGLCSKVQTVQFAYFSHTLVVLLKILSSLIHSSCISANFSKCFCGIKSWTPLFASIPTCIVST